jgi:N-acetyl sugar amidotransferase
MKNRPYQMCTRCVMDTSAPDITFDSAGICNYCANFLSGAGHLLFEDPTAKEARLQAFVAKVKQRGRGKAYDCVVGVSGGVDSSWVLVKTVELGLRPLAVHMDNGWNSELAQNNIANLVRGLGVDLYTHVIDWQEYRTLMQAFFDADVIDIELLYDNAMLAVNFQQAAKFGVHFILSGSNTTSEGMKMPRSWHAFKFDKKNINCIAKRFGVARGDTFPAVGALDRVYFETIKRISWEPFLDYLDYNKFNAMKELSDKYMYKPYPYKHYESIFTRFYQGFILPTKFGIDKRRVHLGTLVIVGQMARDAALIDLASIPYVDQASLDSDEKYFLKKMKWTKKDLTEYLKRPRQEHEIYGSEEKLYDILKKIYAFTISKMIQK